VIGQCRSDRHFDSLQSIEHQQPELTVEDVEIQNVVEGYALPKVIRLCTPERDHVGRKPVVADTPDVSLRTPNIGDDQTTILHARHESSVAKGRFVVDADAPLTWDSAAHLLSSG